MYNGYTYACMISIVLHTRGGTCIGYVNTRVQLMHVDASSLDPNRS